MAGFKSIDLTNHVISNLGGLDRVRDSLECIKGTCTHIDDFRELERNHFPNLTEISLS